MSSIPTVEQQHDVLLRAADLVEKGWARGANARYRNGKECYHRDDRATNFCLYGAVSKVSEDLGLLSGITVRAVTRFARVRYNKPIFSLSNWNDLYVKNKREAVNLLRDTAKWVLQQ